MRKPSKEKLIKKFNLIQDSREQIPYSYAGHESIVRALPCGDYTIEYDGYSYEDHIVVERKKEESEIFSAAGSERERFERELVKLARVPIKFVLCEFAYLDLVNKQPPGLLPASSVYGSIAKWHAFYGVPFIFCQNRSNARAYMYKVFFSYVKHKILEVK